MSTVRVVQTLLADESPSNSSSSDSISSLRFAVAGSNNSNFTVTDTRKCCKRSLATKYTRDSELPLPPTKPKPTRASRKAVHDWKPWATGRPDQPKQSNQVEVESEAEAEPQSSLFEICVEEEKVTEGEEHGEQSQSTPDTSVESISDPSGNNYFEIPSPHSSVSVSQLLLRGFRPDLDEEVQKNLMKEYRTERHAAWVKLHPAANAKNSEVRKWPKRQQAMGLSLLVAEAHIHMRKQAKSTRPPVEFPALPNSVPSRAIPPPGPTLDVKDCRTAAMLLYDIFLLIDNNNEEVDNYEAIRAQIHGLNLWNRTP